jgi:DNA-binding CsgD family transcriptional regulator
MTPWHAATPFWYSDTAEQHCTPKQLDVLRLASHDLTDQQIADVLGITRQAAHQRRTTAANRIRQALTEGAA